MEIEKLPFGPTSSNPNEEECRAAWRGIDRKLDEIDEIINRRSWEDGVRLAKTLEKDIELISRYCQIDVSLVKKRQRELVRDLGNENVIAAKKAIKEIREELFAASL